MSDAALFPHGRVNRSALPRLLGCLLLILAPTGVRGASPGVTTLPVDEAASSLPDSREPTIWFGGVNAQGLAYEGGIWDFADSTLQGWTSVDAGAPGGTYFAWVTAGTFTGHGDPCVPMFPQSTGQIWCGVHQDEAAALEYVAGMGYGNDFCQSARSPEMPVSPATDAIDIRFRYFNDSENDFDYTHVYVRCYDSSHTWIEDHLIVSLTDVIGSYQNPVLFDQGVEVPAGTLDPATAWVRLEFRFTSDPGYSDQDGFYPTSCGPFAADDVVFTVGASTEQYDFEGGPQGWQFSQCGAVGTFMGLAPESTWRPWAEACGIAECNLTNQALEFVDEAGSPYNPPGHPYDQWERAISPVIPRNGYIPPTWTRTVAVVRGFFDLPWARATVFRPGYMYYPYTTPQNPTPRWSPPMANGLWYYAPAPGCRTLVFNLSSGFQPLPADWDSLRFTFEVRCDCQDFDIDPCLTPGDTRGTPVIDDIRIGISGGPIAACCVGSYCAMLTAATCDELGGQWFPDQTICTGSLCGDACCIGEGCVLLAAEDCVAAGGYPVPGLNSCAPNPCSNVCCTASGCQVTSLGVCESLSGTWMQGFKTCSPDPCDSTYTVAPDGSADFRTIQEAIDAAPDGFTVELADGIHYASDVRIWNKNVKVRSHSGDPLSCIVDFNGGEGFFFYNAAGPAAGLEGLTLRFGHTTNRFGGAIVCSYASPVLRNLRIRGNYSPYGGGLACLGEGSHPSLIDVTFLENSAIDGGAVFVSEQAASMLQNVVFSLNHADHSGGAVFCQYWSSATVDHCVFVQNSAGSKGGGISCSETSTVQATAASFWGNGAPSGAGVQTDLTSGATLDRCIISQSTQGAAVSDAAANAVLTCSDLHGNAGGDWTGSLASQLGILGNIALDPEFCDPSNDEFHLRATSPCAADNNPGCGQIGRYGPGCGPLAPSEITAEAQDSTRIGVTWVDNSPNEMGFRVNRRVAALPWEEVASLPPSTTSWVDSLASLGLPHCYSVSAWDSYGYSVSADIACVTSTPAPAAPDSLSAAPASGTAVGLVWADHSTDEIGFQLQRRTAPDGPWTAVAPAPGANTETFTDTDLTPGTTYAYRLRSYTEIAHSAWSTIAEVALPPAPDHFSATVAVRIGALLVSDVAVYQASGAGFVFRGTTGETGQLLVDSLAVGDTLRAVRRYPDYPAAKEGHEAVGGAMLSLQVDSDEMQVSGDWTPYRVSGQYPSYELELDHPIYQYALVVSVQWDVPSDDPFWSTLAGAIEDASSRLYNMSDGQIALDRVAVYDDGQRWSEADVRVSPAGVSSADIDGIFAITADLGAIRMGRTVGDQEVGQPAWVGKLTQLLGHYALGLYEEYLNGLGLEGTWYEYRAEHPEECPQNFGVMDDPLTTTEISSANDYLFSYPAEPDPQTVTRQFFESRRPCWTAVDDRLTSLYPYESFRVNVPPFGWYPGNVSADRLGPGGPGGRPGSYLEFNSSTKAAPPLSLRRFDSGPGTATTSTRVTREGAAQPGALVYKLGRDGLVCLGRTNGSGELAAVGLADGDEIRAYAIDGGKGLRVAARGRPDAANKVALSIPSPPASGGRGGGRAPGVVIDARPTGTPLAPAIALELWADGALSEPPGLVCFYGSRVESLLVSPAPGQNHYHAGVTLNPAEPRFDGRGTFEVTMIDMTADTTVFVGSFTLSTARPIQPFTLRDEMGNVHASLPNGAGSQLGIATSWSATPYFPEGAPGFPVAAIFSVHTGVNDAGWTLSGLNLGYPGSLVAGLDETSLQLRRWDPENLSWTALNDEQVAPARDVISAPIGGGGTFALFALADSPDETAPAQVTDLGAAMATAQGGVELFWTAPGDDNSSGSALEYILGYMESATTLTESVWHQLPKYPTMGVPQAAGSSETRLLTLPRAGQRYYLALRSKDEAGNLSPISNVAEVTSGVSDPNLLPGAPTRFRAVDRPGDAGQAVSLTWRKSSDDGAGKESVTGYRVYRSDSGADPVLLREVPAGTASMTDSTLANNASHTYWVSATDGSFENWTTPDAAFAARNLGSPLGDLTSDDKIGIDDLGRFVDAYGLDSTQAEFDPLFDFDQNGEVLEGDFGCLQSHFGDGGVPATDPPGENGAAQVLWSTSQGGGGQWYLDLRARSCANLAGYAVRVTYPPGALALAGATPDSAGVTANLLNRQGGRTPLFLCSSPSAGVVWVANAIAGATASSSPEGNGFLGRIIFTGSGMSGVSVSDAVLLDSNRLLNHLPGGQPPSDVTAGAPAAPPLLMSRPNPFRGTTVVSFGVPREDRVSLQIFDVQGRLVRTLEDRRLAAGVHSVDWDGRTDSGNPAASGVYLCRLKGSGFERGRPLILLR